MTLDRDPCPAPSAGRRPGAAVVGVIATSAGSGQGIGFAVPVEHAAALVARAGS